VLYFQAPPLELNFWLGHCFKAVTLPYLLLLLVVLYIETPVSSINRHIHAHKCLYYEYMGFEPATSCVVGKCTAHYAKTIVKIIELAFPLTL
jgi:hypothetical protein